MNLAISPNPTPVVGGRTSARSEASPSRETPSSTFAADHIVRSVDDQYDATERDIARESKLAVTLFGAYEGAKVSAYAGGMIGASIGTMLLPGVGSLSGELIGGIAGTLIGIIGGAAAGEKLAESIKG